MSPLRELPEDEAPSVRAYSLGRPLAGAIARGPCRIVPIDAIAKLELPAEGVLLAIHANQGWDPQLAARLVGSGLWPECPQAEAEHPQGLLAVALVTRLEWTPANGPAAGDPWAVGPWAIVLEELEAFEKPVPATGWRGFFELPDQLAGRIQAAWVNRPR